MILNFIIIIYYLILVMLYTAVLFYKYVFQAEFLPEYFPLSVETHRKVFYFYDIFYNSLLSIPRGGEIYSSVWTFGLLTFY